MLTSFEMSLRKEQTVLYFAHLEPLTIFSRPTIGFFFSLDILKFCETWEFIFINYLSYYFSQKNFPHFLSLHYYTFGQKNGLH